MLFGYSVAFYLQKSEVLPWRWQQLSRARKQPSRAIYTVASISICWKNLFRLMSYLVHFVRKVEFAAIRNAVEYRSATRMTLSPKSRAFIQHRDATSLEVTSGTGKFVKRANHSVVGRKRLQPVQRVRVF